MKPLVVVWRVTGRCNLGCGFCGYDRRLAIPRHETEAGLVLRFAEAAAGLGRPVLFSWLGGEPLLWPALAELTAEIRRRHRFAISTTTNGTSLHRAAVRRHLIEHYAELTVSLDGPAQLHDALRGRRGLFGVIERGVRRLAGRGPRLRINAVLTRETAPHFPALCRQVADWGIDEISCNQLGGVERPEFWDEHRLLPDQVAELVARWPGLRAGLAARGVRLLGGAGYLRRLAASAAGERLPVDDCGPGRDYLFVTETGVASPCSFTTPEYGIDLRGIASAGQLADLPRQFAALRVAHRAAACHDCHSTQVCGKFA